MKSLSSLSPEELASLVCEALRNAGVTVTLSGGACVGIWSKGRYVSNDLDFIEEGPVPRQQTRAVLATLGFREEGRHFIHSETAIFIEFPTGPLMVGDQRVHDVSTRKTPYGILRLLTPTDCVKDRLAAFYHWNDRQSLEQALLVAKARRVDLKEIRRWSVAEGSTDKFKIFKKALKPKPAKRKRG